MQDELIQTWLAANAQWAPWVVAGSALVLSAVVFWVARFLIARVMVYWAGRTANQYDDIIVKKLRPFRFAGITPLLVLYYFAGFIPDAVGLIRQILLFLILWLLVITANSLLDAVNAIFEASALYRGEPIQGYLDVIKILVILVSIILSISIFTGESPIALLSGLGAVTAVLLLLFRDTLLSFVASIEIQSNDLVREGDWLEVPSYGADGDVVNMALHAISIRNWDKSVTMIPTYKLLEVPYKNWRGMAEVGGRRIKRSVHIDLNSLRFCDGEMLDRFARIGLVKDFVEARAAETADWDAEHGALPTDPLGGRRLSNIDVFQAYVERYLAGREDLHQEGLTLLVRQLAPGPSGLPVEVYAFTKTVDWAEYEAIQAEIIDHLLTAMPMFDLRVFQQPTGADLRSLVGSHSEATGAGVQAFQ